jgi:hypothetical protein
LPYFPVFRIGFWNLLDIESQQVVLSSIFPEKIQFDGKNCRTPKVNEAIRLILATDKGSINKKEGDKLKKLNLSPLVENRVIKSNSFYDDLELIHGCICKLKRFEKA